MPKRVRAATTPRADFGPDIRLARGDVITELRADPDRPQGTPTKGARAAQGGHDYLHRRGSLDAAQHAAAERYAAAWHGMARSGCHLAAAMHGTGNSSHAPAGPTTLMIACAADIRAAHATLGNGAAWLVHGVVIEGRTLGTLGGAAGEGDQVTLGRLRAALDRLAEMWGLE